MKPATADAPGASAYVFLRRVEHRIQYLDDQQTHLLPTADADLGWIAHSMGLSCGTDACELLDRLGEVRELVATEFDALLHDGQAPVAGIAGGRNGCVSLRRRARCRWTAIGCSRRLPRGRGAERVRQWITRIRAWWRCATRASCGWGGWSSGRPIAWPTSAAVSLRRCASSTGSSHCCKPRELPHAAGRAARLCSNGLLRLLGMARWPMQYLMRHPGVIDELADERLRHGRLDAAAVFISDLQSRHDAWAQLGPGQRGMAARHAAPCAPRRAVPHAGARRGARAHGGAGGRRPVGAWPMRCWTPRFAGPGPC